MTNRELLESAVILRALEDPIPSHVTSDWFTWGPAQAAWRVVQPAQQAGRTVDLADLLMDPATAEVTEAVVEVGTYFTHIREAVAGLQAYVDRDWLGAQWRAAMQGLQQGDEVRSVMDRLRTALDHQLAEESTGTLVSAQDAAMQVYADLERRKAEGTRLGLPYGWASWDGLTNGLEGGQLIIVGARTGVGKTLIGGNLTRNWAQRGAGTLYFSLEMRARKLMARWMAAESDLNSLILARGTLHASEDWAKASIAMGHTSRWPIWIRDQPTTLSQCVQMIREAVRDRAIRVAVVDYAGLLGNDPAYRGESTAAQVGRVAKTLKNIAMECDIPVVCLVQVNRAVEHRGDGVPTLADLRDSGDWEASADVVWLLMAGATKETLTAILAKNRDGPANVTMTMGWKPQMALIWDKEGTS